MKNDDFSEELLKKINDFARATEVPPDSFLMRRFSFEDPDRIQSAIDGLTLSLISYCYHRHPRGENVHEIMEQLEQAEPGSEEAQKLEVRADDAAALQIPFIVTVNKLLEDYFNLRRRLEERLPEQA